MGGLLTAGGALLALMRATDGGPHGGAFLALGVVAVLPVGAALLIAGLAAVRRWRGRRWLHVLPPLALAGTVLYLRWLLP